ncbi:hypothetical protein CHISP_1122 [Chitinispirillum alkaliphilum]|nr:hypothetical protein CHISP_1122 [Chitinispirillum alkaliphilum]
MKTGRILLLVMTFIFVANADYFLKWPQKGELMLTGRVTDIDSNHYNVRILPGYFSSLTFGGDSWVNGWQVQRNGGYLLAHGLLRIPLSFTHFRDYVSPRPWRGIGSGFRQMYNAERFLFTEFMFSNVGETWGEYWSQASNAHRKQSFGWWFAYPWATIKGVVNTTLRYTLGLSGSAFVLAYGTVLRPAYEISRPVLMTGTETVIGTGYMTYGVLQTSWGLGVNQLLLGTATPISGVVWNTALGVPMSLFGKAPTLESVDGWWITLEHQWRPSGAVPQQPDSLEIISMIDYHLNIARYEMTMHTTRIRQRQEIDSLLKVVRDVHRHQNDSIRSAYLSSPPPVLSPNTNRIVWTEKDRLSLMKTVMEYIDSHISEPLSHYEKKRIANNVISKWINRPSEISDRRRGANFNPNSIIQDEVKEIFDLH